MIPAVALLHFIPNLDDEIRWMIIGGFGCLFGLPNGYPNNRLNLSGASRLFRQLEAVKNEVLLLQKLVPLKDVINGTKPTNDRKHRPSIPLNLPPPQVPVEPAAQPPVQPNHGGPDAGGDGQHSDASGDGHDGVTGVGGDGQGGGGEGCRRWHGGGAAHDTMVKIVLLQAVASVGDFLAY